jgi:hypothetical protein
MVEGFYAGAHCATCFKQPGDLLYVVRCRAEAGT